MRVVFPIMIPSNYIIHKTIYFSMSILKIKNQSNHFVLRTTTFATNSTINYFWSKFVGSPLTVGNDCEENNDHLSMQF